MCVAKWVESKCGCYMKQCVEVGGMKVWVLAKTVWRGGWNESAGDS